MLKLTIIMSCGTRSVAPGTAGHKLLVGEPITASVMGIVSLLLNVSLDVLVETILQKIGGLIMKPLHYIRQKLRAVPVLKKLMLAATTSVITAI